jgi:tetratricopeptide (TPR) repeat protein
VQYAQENLGIVLYNQRRFGEAASVFEGSLRPMQSLASVEPDNKEYQKEASNALGWVAQTRWALGDFDAAIALRQKQIAFLEAHLGGGSDDVLFRQQLLPAHQALGLLFTQKGQTERGIEEFRLGLAEASRLVSVESGNSNWKANAANVQLELARNLLAAGQRAEAAEQTAGACQVISASRARDPGIARWRTLQTMCLDRRARLALAAGDTAQALALSEQALGASQVESSSDPATDRYRIASQSRLLGDIRQHSGDSAGAKAAWSAGLAQLPKNVAERPWDMNERAELLRRLGRAGEAQPLVNRLAAIGYRNVN